MATIGGLELDKDLENKLPKDIEFKYPIYTVSG